MGVPPNSCCWFIQGNPIYKWLHLYIDIYIRWTKSRNPAQQLVFHGIFERDSNSQYIGDHHSPLLDFLWCIAMNCYCSPYGCHHGPMMGIWKYRPWISHTSFCGYIIMAKSKICRPSSICIQHGWICRCSCMMLCDIPVYIYVSRKNIAFCLYQRWFQCYRAYLKSLQHAQKEISDQGHAGGLLEYS